MDHGLGRGFPRTGWRTFATGGRTSGTAVRIDAIGWKIGGTGVMWADAAIGSRTFATGARMCAIAGKTSEIDEKTVGIDAGRRTLRVEM